MKFSSCLLEEEWNIFSHKTSEGILYLHHRKETNYKTRTKTSIRYAKENDREKREWRREREKKVEWEI